jgi:hypothetical protein
MRIQIDTTNKYIVLEQNVNAKEFINEIYELLGDDYVNYSIVKPIEQSQLTYVGTNNPGPYFSTTTGFPIPQSGQEMTSIAYKREVLGLSDEEIKNEILEKRTKVCNCDTEQQFCGCCKPEQNQG